MQSAFSRTNTSISEGHGSAEAVQQCQLPRVKRSRIDVSAEVREGQSLLIGCVPTYEQKEFFYVLLTVHHAWTAAELN
jgi:hypothetical protein